MSLTEEEFENIVEDVLTDLPFVKWDRCIEWVYEGKKCTNLYGWIEREEDDYKDFVLVGVYEVEDKPEANVEFHGTSSKKYSKEIHSRLYPNEDADEMHNECIRVENRFDVENAVALDKSQKGDSNLQK